MKYIKGQLTIITTIILAVGTVSASAITAWATASSTNDSKYQALVSKDSDLDKRIDLGKQAEELHYQEISKKIDAMDKKLDRLIETR